MKILHTSDLHLGHVSRGGIARLKDQERVLDEILDLCKDRNVDMLLITGDVFSDRTESNRTLAQVAKRLLEHLRDHLRQGRTVFLLRGNHDPLDLFQLIHLILKEIGGTAGWPLMVADVPAAMPVPGHNMKIVALPYLTPSMLQHMVSDPGISPEQRVAGLSGQLAQQLELLYRQEELSSPVPAIFAGHIMVQGARVNEQIEFESGYNRELSLAPDRLPHFTSYNALGHIHLSQAVNGAGKPTWYAGAPERLDLGERDYTPQVLLVTTPLTAGGSAVVEPIALTTPTPFVDTQLNGLAAVEEFYAQLEQARGVDPLGVVTIDVPPAERSAVLAKVQQLIPRIQIRWAREESPLNPPATLIDYHNVAYTVEQYLKHAYADQPKRQEQLLAAFASLWNESSQEAQG